MNQSQLGSFESIPLAAIRPSPTNPRKNFDPIALAELTRSIGEMGVQVPLLLREISPYFVEPEGTGFVLKERQGEEVVRVSFHGDEDAAHSMAMSELKKYNGPNIYEIVAGERRFRAAKEAGLDEVHAQIKELSDREVLDIQLVENLQRQDLHPVEEAEGYRVLLASGATPEDVAKKAGKDLAYVKKRIALLQLEVDAKQLFADGYLTLGHALLLARLTPKDQIGALVFLLGIAQWEIKRDRPAETLITERVKRHAQNQKSEVLRGRRLVDKTETELQEWIRSSVLLQLKGVPWDLGDGDLLPIAGPCTTCPKRTGANAALFLDLTTSEDTCTDPACFGDKQKAFADRKLAMAKESGSPLLKLSSKQSNAKLEAPVIEMKPGPLAGKPGAMQSTKKAVVVTNKPVKEGQWVESKKNGCPSTVEGLFTDGPNKGKVRYVCANQKCDVHKHRVDRPQTQSNARQESYQAQEKKREELAKQEQVVRRAVLEEIIPEVNADQRFLQNFLISELQHTRHGTFIATGLKLTFNKVADEWRTNELARAALLKHVENAGLVQMHMVGFFALAAEAMNVSSWQLTQKDGIAEDRKRLWSIAKHVGVDPDAIVARVQAAQLAAEEPKSVDEGKGKKLSAAEQKKRKAGAAKKFNKPAAKKTPAVDGKSLAAGAGTTAEQAGA